MIWLRHVFATTEVVGGIEDAVAAFFHASHAATKQAKFNRCAERIVAAMIERYRKQPRLSG